MERFIVPEIMFNPAIVDELKLKGPPVVDDMQNAMSLPAQVLASIQNADVDAIVPSASVSSFVTSAISTDDQDPDSAWDEDDEDDDGGEETATTASVVTSSTDEEDGNDDEA